MPLQSRFLSQLGLLSDKLLKLFEKRGRQTGKHLQSILEHMTQVRMHFGGENTDYMVYIFDRRKGILSKCLDLLIPLDLGWRCWCRAGMRSQGPVCVPQQGPSKSSERICGEYNSKYLWYLVSYLDGNDLEISKWVYFGSILVCTKIVQVYLKKFEYCEKVQYFLSLISESKSNIIHTHFITHYFMTLWLKANENPNFFTIFKFFEMHLYMEQRC